MDYAKKDLSPEEEGGFEAREPMAVYGVGGPSVAEPWAEGDEGEEVDDAEGWLDGAVKHTEPKAEPAAGWSCQNKEVEEHIRKWGKDVEFAPDGGDWFDWLIKNDTRFREHLERGMDETDEDMRAGRLIPHEEFWGEIEREIRNGRL
jgi:hypothetical protein